MHVQYLKSMVTIQEKTQEEEQLNFIHDALLRQLRLVTVQHGNRIELCLQVHNFYCLIQAPNTTQEYLQPYNMLPRLCISHGKT